MLTIAVVQQKGGSGKTTLAVNLAAAAHLDGLRTLLLDMDRQGSALAWAGCERREGSKLEALAAAAFGIDRPLSVPEFLRRAEGFDCVVIDGPPRLDDITQSAAVVADVALLPMQPGPFDFWAVGETIGALDRADRIRAELGRVPIRRAFVLNRAPRGTRLASDGERELRRALRAADGAELGGGSLVGVVHQRVAFPEAAARGESVFTYPGALLAAADIERLWRAVRKLSDGASTQHKKTKSRARG